MALREAIKEQLYLSNVGRELPMFESYIRGHEVYTDSQTAINLALNPRHHQRTKYVDILYHFISVMPAKPTKTTGPQGQQEQSDKGRTSMPTSRADGRAWDEARNGH